MIRFLARSLVLAGFAGLSCATSTLTTGLAPITALSVDPAWFLHQGVTCSDGDAGTAGAMRVYVATIYDVSPFPASGPNDPAASPEQLRIRDELEASPEKCYPARRCFVLPSSAPTSCFRPVLFQRIVSGRQYVADVDGYDRADIEPLAPGSRVMVDAQKHVVAPRWTTSCGRSLGPAVGVPVGHIIDLRPDAGPSPFDGGGRAADAGPPVLLPDNYYDSGLPGQQYQWQWYANCRERKYYDAAAWLDGPVCAFEFETETFKGCSGLTDTSVAGN